MSESALNELLAEAGRELGALGVSTRLAQGGDSLQGEIAPVDLGGVTHPATWEAIPRLGFRISADGRMILESPPPLEGLVVDFVGAGSAAQLVARIRHGLRERFARIGRLRDRLQGLGLKAAIDSQRLLVVSRVDLEVSGVVELEGGDFGVVARRLIPALGDRSPIPLDDGAVDLNELSDRVDVELCVAQYAEKALARRSAGPPGGSGARTGLSGRSAKQDGPSLELLVEKLGGDAVPQPGLAVTRTFEIDGRPARFTARLAEMRRFVGRLSCGDERLWEGSFDLDELTHLDEFVAALRTRAAGGGGEIAQPSRRQWSEAEEELVAGLLPPAAGERWVLDAHVEHEDADEIRYRGLNIAGRPSGATRVLPRPNFERTFTASGVGYRMLVSVLEVGADYVTYQTLDAGGRAASSPRRVPLIVFMANFTPEGSA